MQTVTLGRTGLRVSVAGLGTGGKSRIGQGQGKGREHSVALVGTALDLGVNFIDTAALYGTEEIVGEALRGRRDEVVISTKVGITPGGLPDPNLIDADELERRVEDCLRRLGMERIDILHLHAVAPDQHDHVCTELVPRLERLRDAGKIAFTGLTERFTGDTTHKMLERAVRDPFWDVLMIGFNFVNQTALRTVLPEAERRNLGTLCMFAVRGPLARPAEAAALVRRLADQGEIDPALLDPDPLAFLTAPGVAASLSDAAYRFCRHAPGMHVVVTGTGDEGHLRENVAAINASELPPAVIERLARIFRDVRSESCEP